MTDKKNFLLASGFFQPYHLAVKPFTFAKANIPTFVERKTLTLVKAKVSALAFFSATALVILATTPLNAHAQNCTAVYEPGVQPQRISTGLFDGRVGPVKVINNTENATVISLYHPDAPKRVFKYWYAEPGKSYLLGTDNYSSDWGIQVDEGPICIVGRVASWDGSTFTTFPSRLYIADTLSTEVLPSTRSTIGKSQSSVAPVPSPQLPSAYEVIALKQLTEGEVRSGLISLLRAADLYKASGQTKEEKRVRDRVNQLRGS